MIANVSGAILNNFKWVILSSCSSWLYIQRHKTWRFYLLSKFVKFRWGKWLGDVPTLHFLVWSGGGRGGGEGGTVDARMVPISADLLHRPPCLIFLSLYPRVFIVRLWPCFHHGGHFDADVFRHHGPRLPLLHHLHALIRLPAAEAAGVHSGGCSIFPASLDFVMDNGRGPFLDTCGNALKSNLI